VRGARVLAGVAVLTAMLLTDGLPATASAPSTPSATSMPSAPARAVGSEVQIDIPAPGPFGPITVIGDSVLVGAAIEPSLPNLLAQSGWGPVRFRAGLGYSAGNLLPANSTYSVAAYIRQWRAAGWDPPNVMVNLGNNDVGFCGGDVACNAAGIRFVMDTIGPGHTVWWSKITRFPFLTLESRGYNAALDLVAAERDDLILWDWPAVRAAEGVALSWDDIHLRDSVAYRRRSVLMAADATRRLVVARRTGGDAPLPAAAAAGAEYLPLPPQRALDTRERAGARLGAGGTVEVDLSTVVPAGASAVAVNLTAVDAAGPGFLTGHPCGTTRPLASSGNYVAGSARSTMSVLPIAASRRLCVYSSAAADVVVDVQGAFVPDATRLTPLAPTRLLDTRATGRAAELTIAMPAGAAAVALNVAVTGSSAPGFVTAYPCGGPRPLVANVTFGAGETISDAAYVPVGAGGSVCLFANVPTDVVVDLTGTFAAGGQLGFVAATPTRQYDTRDGTGGWTPIQGADQVVDVSVAPADAAAVTGVLTMVTPFASGFLAAYGCGDRPATANVNAQALDVVANTVTVGVFGGRMCVLSSAATHVVFDTTGWWVASAGAPGTASAQSVVRNSSTVRAKASADASGSYTSGRVSLKKA